MDNDWTVRDDAVTDKASHRVHNGELVIMSGSDCYAAVTAQYEGQDVLWKLETEAGSEWKG